MRAPLYLLFITTCVFADESEDRKSKLPYVADAVGNKLPPPSNVPATVGSPVNLLTPDRYEFYTFDESGELVKRLMTLEEIQAIVAAGEETEGLVTFANENQPTVAFNFSQPPYTKVHNVVTNVQNVLKTQMEAHKNKPPTQPTLDTPDVSDSWSLILPSIFGNTGVDIVPDKLSGTFTTPETETYELDRPIDDNSFSKEGSTQIFTSSSTVAESLKNNPATEKISTTVKLKVNSPNPTTTTTTTTTSTTTTTQKPSTTTAKPSTTPKLTPPRSTSSKPTTVKLSTKRPLASTIYTEKPKSSSTTTTARPRTTSTTSKPRTTTTTTTTTTTPKPTTKQAVRTTHKSTTLKPILTTRKQITTTLRDNEDNLTRIQIQTVSNTYSSTEKSSIQYEKVSTFSPVSTAAYVTERSTQKFVSTSLAPPSSTTRKSIPSTSRPISTTKPQTLVSGTRKPTTSASASTTLTTKYVELDKTNVTTITTQSVPPSTTTSSSTEFISIDHHNNLQSTKPTVSSQTDNIVQPDPNVPFFDISQSFSQIASDLGNYRPIPTTSDLLDTTKLNDMNLESKENLEIDIPVDDKDNEIKTSSTTEKVPDNYVKITTLDPHPQNNTNTIIQPDNDKSSTKIDEVQIIEIQNSETTTAPTETTTIDKVLSQSMGELFSQIVNQSPQAIINENNSENITTTETLMETTTNLIMETESTTENALVLDTQNSKQKKSNSSKVTEDNLGINTTPSIKIEEKSTEKPVSHEDLKINVSESVKNNSIPITNSTKNEDSVTKQPPKANNNKIQEINGIKSNSQSTFLIKEEQSINSLNNQTIKIDSNNQSTSHTLTKAEINSIKKVETQSNMNKIISADDNKLNKDKENNLEKPLKSDDFKKKVQKVNIDEKEIANERNSSWKLISTVAPPKANEIQKDKLKNDNPEGIKDINLDVSNENQGLEITTKDLNEDVAQFTELCNELAFRYWHTMIENIDKKRSFVLSPYSITSMLAMMFMGARGATSGEMNDILKLDDMVTFNPHFTLKNISDSLEITPTSGVAVSAFIRELFSDRDNGKILTFYKERAQHFYNGHVEEVNFKLISDIIRRRTNLLVKRYTWGKILEYMKSNTITMQPPLAAFSVNIFQTDCSESSVEGRDGEMYFVVSPNVRQRRLVPVPAVVYKSAFLAGYDPVLDATAASLGNTVVSILFVMPGQQGNVVHADDLEALEKRLLESTPTTTAWKRLLRTLLPRMGLELQIPRFSHKSLFNVSSTLKNMGLKDLFDSQHADLAGLIGPSKDLYLSDMIQSTTFVTCGEGVIGEQHHIEEYPENLGGPQRKRTSRRALGWDEPRDYQRAFHDPHDVGEAMHLPLHLRPRQARLPARNAQPARLKFDRPFLYFVRHNPTGMILYVGRYNPRLLP